MLRDVANVLRIGAISEMTGVSSDVLRVWERRYGLLRPERTAGGFRLYTEADAERVRQMQTLLARGLRAGDAARLILEGHAPYGSQPDTAPLERLQGELLDAMTALDESALQAALDELLGGFDLDTAISRVLIPALSRLGSDWASGTVDVGQEHFGVTLVRARMLALARGWDRGLGPRALLACPPGELHDVSLIMFGLALHRRGWRVAFLGADTPLSSLEAIAHMTRPEIVVLYAHNWSRQARRQADLGELARKIPLLLAGDRAEAMAASIHTRAFVDDPVAVAEALTREQAERRSAAAR